MFIPAIRWMARQLPTVAKAAQSAADGIQKTVKAVWGWFFGGSFKSNVAGLFTGATDTIKEAFSGVTSFFADIWGSIEDSARKFYNATLRHIPGLKEWEEDDKGGGSNLNPDGIKETLKETLKNLIPFTSGSNDDSAGTGQTNSTDAFKAWALGIGGVAAGGTALNTATSSVKLGNSRIGRNPNLDNLQELRKGWTSTSRRTGMAGWAMEQELNPFRRFIPASGIANTVTKPIAAATKAVPKAALNALWAGAEGLGFGGGASSAGIQPPGGAASKPPVGQGFFGNLDAGPEGKYNAGSNADVLAKLKGHSPTKLSNAVNAFHKWTQKTGRGLSGAGSGGAAAFTNIFDEGLSLADDVVRIAGKTPGMGFVGQIVSVGFKKVIPGIAGAYMVGETVADLWRMAKSEGDWLGDYKSLDAYSSEAMGSLFAKGSGPGGLLGMGLLGKPTAAIGNIQSLFGGGTGISDWQENLTQAQKDQGVLSAGKAADMLVRGTSGFGGAALSTFFPGLGTLAGTALYEGGRMSTTGIPNPFGEGQLGGNESKYGPAQAFSDLIIQAIKEGFSSGVSDVPII